MSNYPFSELSEYAKYLQDSCNKELQNCGCCPPGLSAVYDNNGNHMGCLTPNDAMIVNDKLKTNTIECPQGSIKAYAPNGMYIGCLKNVADYTTVLATYPPFVLEIPFRPRIETQKDYIRFFNHNSESEEGKCSSCDKCADKCSCCPHGTVQVIDSCGNNLGCVTAKDAYSMLDRIGSEKINCDNSYVKAIQYPNGIFYGCLTPEELTALYNLLT